ncbi:OLC1v1007654C1 [Oldenlandia corymbosa var. corymbosa]|uniref:OLC1v1007654C1 n=1 Tax=Oldenlandia corymbosa var. corymbosa TaxID=529605 RepID=A0AAV1DM54_OLDCO|nr:OLC1v1007654C1 [Oldenlandia corymbosa var. corymbosa]
MDVFFRGLSSFSGNGLHHHHQQQFDSTRNGGGCQFDQYHLFNTHANNNGGGESSDNSQNDDSPVGEDYFDGVFKYLQQMLMEEEDDLSDKPCMFQDILALQAAEKSFYEALNPPPPPERIPPATPTPAPTASITTNSTVFGIHCLNSPADDFAEICPPVLHQIHSQLPHFLPYCGPPPTCSSSDVSVHFDSYLIDGQHPSLSSNKNSPVVCLSKAVPSGESNSSSSNESSCSSSRQENNKSNNHLHRSRENNDDDPGEENGRCSKQFARCNQEETDQEEQNREGYDNALLCPGRNPNFYGESGDAPGEFSSEKEGLKKPEYVPPTTAKRGRPKAGSKRQNIREVVDLRDVLTRCAHSAANFDNYGANELLKKIRQHSSPYGDPTERLAHCFGNALEARITGMGTALYTSFTSKRASAFDVLRAYQAYLRICPFQRMSNIFANKNIAKTIGDAARVHVIDFGILYGFQWPCLLHGISLRPGGPPKLKITGIDLPQPGFRPAERIEETGRRLASYAKRFNVPFEFHAIAKRWETITEDDLMIDRDGNETLIVNCVYRMRNVPDEVITTIQGNGNPGLSPRDCVLNLIRRLNPAVFVHGILNGTYNAPFFETRFKEAMYHFSSFFDMFEATLPREDPDRMMFEKEVMGREVMNVVACEGSERIERPDSYKKWSVRNSRAGFRPMPLDAEIMREVKIKTKMGYHKEFLVDECNNWILQGWKGRVHYALSCWKPSENTK